MRLLQKPAYIYNLIAKVIFFAVAYGALSFIVSFMIRTHGMTVAGAGGLYALISATASVSGSLTGGLLVDRLALQGLSWVARVPGYSLLTAWLFAIMALLSQSVAMMSLSLFCMLFLFWSSSPAMFSALHAVCGSKRRTLAIAIVFCVANLIGLGLGPVMTEVISDKLGTTIGVGDGLRYAMIVSVSTLIPGGLCMLLAARHMDRDAET